jgi:hypothetical protein
MVGLRRCRGRVIAAVLIVALPAMATVVHGETLQASEPGFSARDGSWVLPVLSADPATSGPSWTAASFEVRTDDRSLPVLEVMAYAPRDGGRPLAAVVLFDALCDEGGQPISPAPWAEAIRRRLAGPGVALVVGSCGADAPEIPDLKDAAADPWSTGKTAWPVADARLWDGVLEALTVLSEADEPDRRLLVLVSDGREESASEHVLASCLDAAVRARIPVYVLGLASGADREADEARLRDLAARSSGQFVADAGGSGGDGAEAAAAVLCERIAAVRGLRIAATGAVLPMAVTVRLVESEGPELQASIAARQPLRAPGASRWYALGGGFLAAIGAAAVLWRQRNATVGELLLTTDSGVRRVPIPREGLTIGSERGNRLRLANRVVSRHHAIIQWREGQLVLTDLRSTRGTAVNGLPVVTHRLVSGDRILVGREVELVFRKARPRGHRRA